MILQGYVVSTGNNSYDLGPGYRDGVPWREASHPYERSVDVPSPTVDGKAGSAWKLHQPGQRDQGESLSVQNIATLQSYPDHIMKAETVTDLVALDLFAGTGWGVACNWLGIDEYGVDNMPEVVETRAANGMATIFHDVWTGLLDGLEGGIELPGLSGNARDILNSYQLLIASPPCQTFSQAGKGEGRKALDQVLAAIAEKRYKNPVDLFRLGQETDPRTALVLTPLAYAHRDRPKFIVFEQVPPVLPVWEAAAKELEEMGYSTWTGILNSEQYGVPQTRRRAILIARNDGIEAAPPTPTHSKYYNRDAKRMDEGVLPWVSMAEALGWGTTAKPSYTVTGGGRETGGYEPFPTGARKGMAQAVEEGDWALRSNYGTNGDPAARGVRALDEPAATITSKADRNKWVEVSSQSVAGGPRAERDINEPALTVTQNSDRVRFEERITDGAIQADKIHPGTITQARLAGSIGAELNITAADSIELIEGREVAEIVEAAAATDLILPERADDEQWKYKDTPSTTIAGDPRITAREHHYHGEQNSTSFRLELAEAEVLQSYPPMVWWGTKGKTFLMIGNAVPPLMARAILSVFLTQ